VNVYYYHKGYYPATLDLVMDSLPLDPWGRPYQYLPSCQGLEPNNPVCDIWKANRRYDGSMVPLNSDFDLCSEGRDQVHPSPRNITAHDSKDAVVRAANGSFVGLGKDY
jgi:general secretion pathway protein G